MKKLIFILLLISFFSVIYSSDFGNIHILRPRQLRTVGLRFDVEINQKKILSVSNNEYAKIKIPIGEQIIYCYYSVSKKFVERNGVYLNVEPDKDYYIQLSFKKNDVPLYISVIDKEEAESNIERFNMKIYKHDESN